VGGSEGRLRDSPELGTARCFADDANRRDGAHFSVRGMRDAGPLPTPQPRERSQCPASRRSASLQSLRRVAIFDWIEQTKNGIVLSKSIFISHAAADKDLAAEIVTLIIDGIGVSEEEVFCSSLTGHGIPAGQNFVEYIKSQIDEPLIVVLLLTPSYYKSIFCIAEMGAAWAKSHQIFPILVPPLSYDNVKDVLLGVQVAKIDDDIKYNELREYLAEKISFKIKSATTWDTKRRSFLKKLPALLSELKIPDNVSVQEHTLLKERLKEAEDSLDANDTEIEKLKAKIQKLKEAKNRAEVAKIEEDFRDTSNSDELEIILEGIRDLRSKIGNWDVFKFMLCHFYDKPYRVLEEDSDAFDVAIRRNLISLGESEEVNWNKSLPKSLHAKLCALRELFDDADRAEELDQYFTQKYEMDLDIDGEDFWEFCYRA
jgi:hypothetical protein